jgi:hypothetical protein
MELVHAGECREIGLHGLYLHPVLVELGSGLGDPGLVGADEEVVAVRAAISARWYPMPVDAPVTIARGFAKAQPPRGWLGNRLSSRGFRAEGPGAMADPHAPSGAREKFRPRRPQPRSNSGHSPSGSPRPA